MATNEIVHRLTEARTNDSLNVNCIGLVLFVLGITSREESISPNAYRIKRSLEIISRGFQNENQIPLDASVIGFWSKEGKFYPHLALLLPTGNASIEVYEREGNGTTSSSEYNTSFNSRI